MVSGKPDELISRLRDEAPAAKADVFITVDGGVLDSAKEAGVLQPVSARGILDNVPASLRDPDNVWIGLTSRARVIVYAKDRVKPEELSTYEDLAAPKWKGRIVMRPASSLYNISLAASLVEPDGEAATSVWARGVASNFARVAKGNDRDQAKDIASGTGDVSLMNTYYLGHMLESTDEVELNAAKSVGVFFPNQKTTGTHINVCGAALVTGAPNKEGAEKLLAWLTSVLAQEELAEGNYEYPVNPRAKLPQLLQEWGDFKRQEIDFSALRRNKEKAVKALKAGGW